MIPLARCFGRANWDVDIRALDSTRIVGGGPRVMTSDFSASSSMYERIDEVCLTAILPRHVILDAQRAATVGSSFCGWVDGYGLGTRPRRLGETWGCDLFGGFGVGRAVCWSCCR